LCLYSKWPNDPEATNAFQKVSVAYDILSTPSTKRLYDSRPATSPYDYFAARPASYAEDTFRGVILGVFNDFLDGDLEVIRALLKSFSDINPSFRMGDEGINSVLGTLQSIRERLLSTSFAPDVCCFHRIDNKSPSACRTLISALHAEVSRLAEVQHEFRQLSYFDFMGRTRLTIQLTRITLSLPVALEASIQERRAILPRQVNSLIKSVDVVLERMERLLKK
jgi:curved DNA-binding protein CbpA